MHAEHPVTHPAVRERERGGVRDEISGDISQHFLLLKIVCQFAAGRSPTTVAL